MIKRVIRSKSEHGGDMGEIGSKYSGKIAYMC